MRLILAILLLLSTRSFAATIGDILWATVETNGEIVNVCVNGFNVNSRFNGFWATNNTFTPSNAYISLVSTGFSGVTPTKRNDRAYLTKLGRLVYPGQNTNDISADGTGTNMIYRVWLSRPIFSNDVDLTFTAFTGSFATTNVATNSAAISGLAMTNLSVRHHGEAKCIANWTWVPHNQWTGTVGRLRAMGFHWSARDGQPLSALQMIVTDEAGTAVTNMATLAIDRTLPDPWPTAEYFSDFTLSTFGTHHQLRCDFVAYPHIGDTNSVLDTRRDLYARPLPCAITNFNDPGGTWSTWIAVVDPANGTNASGAATNVALASVHPNYFFKTVDAAWSSIAASNNCCAPVTTHNDAGGGIVYIITTNTTDFNWTGGTITAGGLALSKTWAITMTYPGQPQAVLTNNSGSRNVGHRSALRDIKIAVVNPSVPFNAGGAVWFDDCFWDSAGTSPIQSITNVYTTHSIITNLAGGLRGVSSQNTAFTLIRGNNLDGFRNQMIFYTALANYHPNTNKAGFVPIDYNTAIGAPPPEFGILYNNYFGGLTGNPGSYFASLNDITNGIAIVQNVFEATGASANPVSSFSSSGNHITTNLLLWHNIYVGERIADWGCSGSETTFVGRDLWFAKNNIFSLSGIKKDYDTTVNSNRTGNWALMNMVGCSGNIFIEHTVNVAAGGFPPEFAGLNSHHPPGITTNIFDFPRFVGYAAYAGNGTATAGGGTYRIHTDSPLFRNQITEWLLPFDLSGAHRSRWDPAGAFGDGNPKRGGMF